MGEQYIFLLVVRLSPPTQGAWIEIMRKELTRRQVEVAPYTGGVD